MSRIRTSSRHTVVPVIVLACTSAALSAQETRVAAPPEQAPGQHFLWLVEDPDGPGQLFLLGSLHVSRPDMYPLPEAIMEAFEASDTVVFETDLAAINGPEFNSRLLLEARYPPGESLATALAPELFAQLEQQAERNGLHLAGLIPYRPWICANFLMVAALRRIGFNRTDGIDQYFLRQAALREKPTVALETPEFQIELFSTLTDREAENYLEQALGEVADVEQIAPQFLELWQNGRAESLAEIIRESFRESPDLYRKWFVARNNAWLTALQQRLRDGQRCFVVVGAGHLVGEDGLVSALAEQGYTVRQL